ncbi:acid phosphatase [Mycolicibacterium aromaticivorans JS19b1 = JCM 16368]|uniref:Acid phosphatase n=1 Tax=Mycolicibacterium aromaticivorans JS19b1 = JCM 16368 TaxID=1440774 RepID=A0A064CN56_9MYCO|nr:alkaline phosphatase family protein [Mycolicibacterium aromaticivorans]KDF02000.1 acid phosphatase [Mycolicibacterium aromaticivorans JS19b1 = JCM 16368]
MRTLMAIASVTALTVWTAQWPARAGVQLPHYDHVVIVVEENHAASQIIGNKSAPFINTLAANGALMTQAFAVAHPSEPNYLALFAGNTFGVDSDACPLTLGPEPNLAAELIASRYSFGGFAEDLPAVGSTVCGAGKYARKHAPWVNFSNVAPAASMPFTSFAAGPQLPTVSFVVPNLDNDMHDGSVAQADTWLAANIAPYANWAMANHGLLIVTFDEDDDAERNQISTILYGADVRPGTYGEPINHYSVLSTVEQLYGLPKTGLAATTPPIASVWATNS